VKQPLCFEDMIKKNDARKYEDAAAVKADFRLIAFNADQSAGGRARSSRSALEGVRQHSHRGR